MIEPRDVGVSIPDPLGLSLARAAFEASTEGTVILATDGTVIAANRAFCRLYAVDPLTIVGRHYMSFSEDLEIRRVGEQVGHAGWVSSQALQGETVSGVVQLVRNLATGTEFFGSYGATPVIEGGRFFATIVTVEDVTEHVRALQSVESALSAAEVGTYRVDLVEDVLWGDANFARLYGLTAEEARGGRRHRLYELVHPDDVEWVMHEIIEATLTGEPHEAEYRIVRPSGEIRWLLSRGRATIGADGRATELLGSVVDVTLRKEAEKALRAQSALYQAVIEAERSLSEADGEYGTLIARAVAEAQRFTGADGASLEIQEGDEMVYEAACGIAKGFVGLRLPFKGSLSGRTVRDALPALCDDTETDERVDREACRRIGIRSMALVPLRYDQRSFGALKVMAASTAAFSPAETQALDILGGFLGAAIGRARATRAMARSGETFQSLVANSPLGIYAVDADFRLAIANPGARRAFASVVPLMGRDFGDVLRAIWPEPIAIEIEDHFRRVLDTGEPYYNGVMVERRADVGEVEAYDWKIERMALPDGHFGVVCHFHDVSERQRMEAELRQSEERQRATLDALPALVLHIDDSMRYRFANLRFEEWFDRSREDLVGRTVRENVGEETYAFVEPFMLRALSGERVGWERWVDFPTGRRFLSTEYIPTRDGEGRVTGFDALATDLTEERLDKEALADAKARTDAVLASADVATWLLDVPNDRLYADRNLARFFDLDEADANGGPAAAYIAKIHPDDQARVARELGEAITEGVPYDIEYRIVAKDEERWVSARGIPERDAAGNIAKLPGVVVDVTQLKRAQGALADANRGLEDKVRERTADLQASNEALNGFMYHVAHDLRAPLRSIASTSRIVMEDYEDVLPEEAMGQLVRQAKAATKLGALIDDLLRLSKLSQQTVERAPIDLTRLSREVAAESLAAHPGTSVRVDVQEGLEAWADPRLLRLALGNLVENAVKYSPEGGKVIVGRHEGGAYFVSDEGIGIDPRYFGKVFEPFQRLHGDEEFSGTGIGLSNVKQVMERHGGKIWVESELGKGSTFLFTLG